MVMDGLLFTVGTSGAVAELVLDPQLKYWVLLPISIVMVLVGILRTYIMTLIGPKVQGQPRVKITENNYISKAQGLLGNGSNLHSESFEIRQMYLSQVLGEGKYVAVSNKKPGEVANPFTDPNASESMMNMAKGNMANFIPQTIIMWWVNHFFAGFVLMKLPFPLTIRFKDMLQAGISTADLDVRWVSSISWYFISVLGLNPLYNLILGDSVDMSSMMDTAAQNPMGGMMGPGQPQPEAVMKGLSNDLIMTRHESCFEHIEERILKKYGRK
ncbi:hypothetical protein TBLA_0A08560 [Henningerozyma blattae CBS 6284]|uniref:ER membrane protein complex subunit 3 n=1 Tax=Henningerozyma blattae (strain ATCC 34711 / CBS 6284 / DSM 70876 / NBRC 10599 / NRRL Y-10934 / UCD 77-7) TaxID=1071380 RepID=I2GWZ4_HENB6|nr:hypothetical protein TBLA_0A08560 [Tetrapisispora blattae CBS 6284]CCH58646.1 hypothetical protein TBLA_0A08560 [Tetrapisispora blattae CBS 6284]